MIVAGADPMLDLQFPLIVVDRSRDPERYASGFLRLVTPADLAQLRMLPSMQAWDRSGRPVSITASGVRLLGTDPEPEARQILADWRRRMPAQVRPANSADDTAIGFIVGDVMVAQARLTSDGATRRPGTALRLLPVGLMLVAALLVIPLVRAASWGPVAVAITYVVAALLVRRWSYPPQWFGDPPRRGEPDLISTLAVASKVVFWSVAAAAVTLTLLAANNVIDPFLPWA